MNMVKNETSVHVGQRIFWFAGYGNISEYGTVVRVTDGARVIELFGGKVSSVAFDVILDDGRHLKDRRSIDTAGIGVKSTDQPSVSESEAAKLYSLAAERAERDKLEKQQQLESFLKFERERCITDAPVFYYNGVRDERGGKLQRAWYAWWPYGGLPEGTIRVYAKDHHGFSKKVRKCFLVRNDTDVQVNYFDKDDFLVVPDHPLYSAVLEAMNKASQRR